MKKIISFLFCVFIIVAFTSCLNVVQEIRYSNGTYKYDYTMTFSKLLLSLSEDDWEDELDDLIEDIESSDDIPNNLNIRKIDNGDSVGLKFDFEVDRFSSYEYKSILPQKKNSVTYIPLFFGESLSGTRSSKDWEDAFTEAMISDYKYTMYVQKSIVKSVSKVMVVDDDGDGERVSFTEERNFFKIDIPIAKLLNDDNYTQVAIYSY